MRERGSALFVAIVSVMVLLLISGVFFSLVTDQMKSNSYEERAIKSYYLAQAGVFYGIAKLRSGFEPTLDDFGMSTEELHDDPFGYGGWFTVRWEAFEEGYKITGTGSYGLDTGEVFRTLQAYYEPGSYGGTPGTIPPEYLTPEYITQPLLVANAYGQANTCFIFNNYNPLDSTKPVNLNNDIYIYIIHKNGNPMTNRYTHNVRISLRNSSDQTIPLTNINLQRDDTTPEAEYKYIIPDFINGVSQQINISYSGTEIVHLVVEGYISNHANSYIESDWTGTIANVYVISTEDGLIWQIEQAD
jgi:hypothetical protein